MNNGNEIFEDLLVIKHTPCVLYQDYFLYEGWLCYDTYKNIRVEFKIKTKEIIPSSMYSSRQDRTSFVFKYIIGQGEFDHYMELLCLMEYKDEFLLYCGDLKKFYLTTKLFLKQDRNLVHKEIEYINYSLQKKVDLFSRY